MTFISLLHIMVALAIGFLCWHLAFRNRPTFRRTGWRTPPSTIRYWHKRKPAWVRDEVIRLKACLPDAGCRNIASTFNRLHTATTGESIGKTWVSEVIRSHRYDIDDLRRRFKHNIPRPIAHNVVWRLDLTGKTDIGGNQHAILGIIDHGSRMVVFLRTATRQTTWSLLGYLFLAIGQYGKPRSVRTDNGSALVSRRFTTVLAMLGIRHQKTDIGCPWQNGRIERLFGTLKERLGQWNIASRKQLDLSLRQFAFWHNTVRPHQHLGGATPSECWQGINPYQQAPRTVEWFEAWDGLLRGYYLRR